MEEDRIEVKTGFGSVKASGNLIVLLVVIAMGFGFLAYMQFDHDKGGKERSVTIIESIGALRKSMDENTFVQTLTEQQKHALNLDMPESLRRKVMRTP